MLQLRDRLKKYQTREVAVWALSIGASICSILIARTLYNYTQGRRSRSSITSNDQDRSSNNGKDNGARQLSTKSSVKSDDRKLFLTIRSARSQLVPAQLWRQFEEAAYRIRNDDESSNHFVIKSLKNGDKLLLYALYKQIVDGNAPPKMIHSRTNWNIMAEKAKYDAWTRMRAIPIHAAIDHYVTAVTHFCSSVPSQQQSQDQPSVSGNGNDEDDTM